MSTDPVAISKPSVNSTAVQDVPQDHPFLGAIAGARTRLLRALPPPLSPITIRLRASVFTTNVTSLSTSDPRISTVLAVVEALGVKIGDLVK